MIMTQGERTKCEVAHLSKEGTRSTQVLNKISPLCPLYVMQKKAKKKASLIIAKRGLIAPRKRGFPYTKFVTPLVDVFEAQLGRCRHRPERRLHRCRRLWVMPFYDIFVRNYQLKQDTWQIGNTFRCQQLPCSSSSSSSSRLNWKGKEPN